MSKKGLETALKYGEKLDSFEDAAQAEQYFFSNRDEVEAAFIDLSKKGNEFFTADYSADSLKGLEKWYFDLFDNNKFQALGIEKEDFEVMMGFYWSEVFIKNNDGAEWIVESYPFAKGKYELMVNKGLMSMNSQRMFVGLDSMPGNKRRNFMSRTYKQYTDF